jgi:hypothetical protein
MADRNFAVAGSDRAVAFAVGFRVLGSDPCGFGIIDKHSDRIA